MEKPEDIEKAASAEDAARQARPAEAKPGDGPPDRRHGSRRRALKIGRIVFSGGNCSMACHILDISDAGARIMPADILMCPDQFVLRPLSGPERACEVVWRKGIRIGVRFV